VRLPQAARSLLGERRQFNQFISNYLRFRTAVASGSELKGLLARPLRPHAGDVDVRLNPLTVHLKARLSSEKFEKPNN